LWYKLTPRCWLYWLENLGKIFLVHFSSSVLRRTRRNLTYQLITLSIYKIRGQFAHVWLP